MRYVFDNCISYRYADMLAALKVNAVPLRRLFAESISDIDLYAQLSASQDVLITYDHKQKTRKAEAIAIKEAGVTSLWIGPHWGKKEFWEQAKWILSRWEKIEQYVNATVPGTCAEIRENGRSMPFALRA